VLLSYTFTRSRTLLAETFYDAKGCKDVRIRLADNKMAYNPNMLQIHTGAYGFSDHLYSLEEQIIVSTPR
jgi:hypothetical protein